MKNQKGQVTGPVLLVAIAVGVVYFVATEVKTGVRKLGCKVHLVKKENCQSKQNP